MYRKYFVYSVDDEPSSEERLPNGYTRKDYYDNGFTDFDIEYWGMDQPGAPDPPMAGWVIWDMLDGELDGEIDF
jgi:hypothetical protein